MSARRIPIAIVLTSFDRGGTERQMTELIRRLDPLRFAVHAVCFRREGPWLARVDEKAASVVDFPLGTLRSAHAARQFVRLARWFARHRIAVVHACDMYANLFALPAAALARVPVRTGSRRGIVQPSGTPGLLRLQALGYRLAHKVIANSEAAAAVLRHEGVPADRVAVIANGIDLESLPAAEHRRSIRTITTVANLRRGKGHDVLLHAAAGVLQRHPDLTFQLVGDGPLRASLEALAASLGIANRVRFLGHRDDVAAILRASDLFAFPSLMEAFPNGVMEAMAAGLPVVATRVGGIPELIEDGRTGLLVPANDAAAMRAGIERLLASAGEAGMLATAAREQIARRYSFDWMVSAFERLWLEQLARRGMAEAKVLGDARQDEPSRVGVA